MDAPCVIEPVPGAATLEFELTDSVGAARRRIESWLHAHGAPPRRVADVVLAGSELLTNARWHGGGPVEVTCSVGDDAITLAVTNQGEPDMVPDPQSWSQPAQPLAPSGRGLAIVKALADQAHVRRADHAVSVETVYEL